jgi:hypothetical protein
VTHIFTCFFMTGLIWLIQIVHYPSYRFIWKDQFDLFQKFHTTKITFIVAPVMILELASGCLLFFQYAPHSLFILNFVLLILTWSTTIVFSIPLHGRLSNEYNPIHIRSLIRTNWPRTILWSIRSVITIYILLGKLK